MLIRPEILSTSAHFAADSITQTVTFDSVHDAHPVGLLSTIKHIFGVYALYVTYYHLFPYSHLNHS
jgi:hypothetical protein